MLLWAKQVRGWPPKTIPWQVDAVLGELRVSDVPRLGVSDACGRVPAADTEQQLDKLPDLYLQGDFQKEMLMERKARLERTVGD